MNIAEKIVEQMLQCGYLKEFQLKYAIRIINTHLQPVLDRQQKADELLKDCKKTIRASCDCEYRISRSHTCRNRDCKRCQLLATIEGGK